MCMNHLVEEIVDELVNRPSDMDCEVIFKSVGEEGYLVSNTDAKKVAAIGVINIRGDDDKIDKIVGAFSINVNKYAWAEAEGFSQDQMIDELNEEIFTLIGVDEVLEYVCETEGHSF